MARVKGIGWLEWHLEGYPCDENTFEVFSKNGREVRYETSIAFELWFDNSVLKTFDRNMKGETVYFQEGSITKMTDPPQLLPDKLKQSILQLSRRWKAEERSFYSLDPVSGFIYIYFERAKTGKIACPDKFLQATARKLSK